MKNIAFILFLLLLSSALYGCGADANVATDASEQPTKIEEEEKHPELNAEGNNKEEESSSSKIAKLEKEKEMFLKANQLGQSLYLGLVNKDTEVLDTLLTYDPKLSDEEFKAYEHLQTYGDVNYREVTTFFLQDDGSLIIIYTIPGPTDEDAINHLVVSFVENEDGQVVIDSFGIDA